MVAAMAADVERRLELVVAVVRVALRARVRVLRAVLWRRSIPLLDRDVDPVGHARESRRGARRGASRRSPLGSPGACRRTRRAGRRRSGSRRRRSAPQRAGRARSSRNACRSSASRARRRQERRTASDSTQPRPGAPMRSCRRARRRRAPAGLGREPEIEPLRARPTSRPLLERRRAEVVLSANASSRSACTAAPRPRARSAPRRRPATRARASHRRAAPASRATLRNGVKPRASQDALDGLRCSATRTRRGGRSPVPSAHVPPPSRGAHRPRRRSRAIQSTASRSTSRCTSA